MSKNVNKLVIALLVLGLLFVASRQSRLIATQDRSVSAPKEQVTAVVLVPEISKYGSLVGLKDAAGKDLLKEVKHRWHEGFAIAYQVRNSKGVYKNRFLYVMGNQVSARKLKVERQKSTTSRKVVTTADRALEIGRLIAWDEKAHALNSQITITNTSNRNLRLRAVEIEIDKQVVTQLMAKEDVWPPDYDVPEPQCPVPQAGINCGIADECPNCPCVLPNCMPQPGQARAFERDPLNPGPLNFRDLIGTNLPRINAPTMCLSWAGANLSPSVLTPGQKIVVQYRVSISPRKGTVP